MLPIPALIWHEYSARAARPQRVPEPQAMEDAAQIHAYAKSYEWGGPASALKLHHIKEMSVRLRPGDTVLDLACGPGPLLLELAALYPECRFFGVDLSGPMLGHLRQQADQKGLKNVTTFCEDICTLPSFADGSVDCVVSTAALHHLPDAGFLRRALQRIDAVLRPQGSLYVFDFGQLNSPKTRALLVNEMAKAALPATVHDYDMSLRASFPIDEVMRMAKEEWPSRRFAGLSSSFVDFFYFLQTPPRADCPPHAKDHMSRIWAGLPAALKLEHLMLRAMRSTRL